MSFRALLPLLALASCGWFATPEPVAADGASGELVNEDPAANLPKCKPVDYKESRGPSPWKVGDSTASGWKVTALDETNVEYIRVTFEKGGPPSTLEVAFNEAGEGEWATKDYRLMPAPDTTAPDDLLADAIAKLKSWQTTQTEPFVRKKAGVDDPYADLPPCGPDGKPL